MAGRPVKGRVRRFLTNAKAGPPVGAEFRETGEDIPVRMRRKGASRRSQSKSIPPRFQDISSNMRLAGWPLGAPRHLFASIAGGRSRLKGNNSYVSNPMYFSSVFCYRRFSKLAATWQTAVLEHVASGSCTEAFSMHWIRSYIPLRCSLISSSPETKTAAFQVLI